MRLVLIMAFALLLGCPVYQPCGWDENLAVGSTYGLGFIENYGPESTTARYVPALDLNVNGFDDIPPCPDIDETGAGRTVVLRTPGEPPGPGNCSIWYPTVVEPTLAVEPRPANFVFNYFGYNMMIVDGFRDLGGGCRGVWELTVHAPENDHFASQNPLGRPLVLAYRLFLPLEESVEACYGVLGLDRAVYDYPMCGDAYVAAMDRR